MSGESYQQRLNRVRKPRVHITYEMAVGDGFEARELPFVMGVIGDFAGNPTVPLRRFDERKFIEIDRENFNQVMKRLNVGSNFKVRNVLSDDGGELQVNLKFQEMEDFEPGRVVEQIEPLRRLLETRNKLRDLLSGAACGTRLEEELEAVLRNSELVEKIKRELGEEP